MSNEELKKDIINKAKELSSYIIEKRRHLHMHPETAFEEYETQAFIEKELQKIGYETKKIAKTGVLAILEGEKQGYTIGLRADIDALNVQEENEVEYKSKNEGKMHACGHDAHTAMLLGAAKIIYDYKDKLEGKVKLIFQPAEEGDGGGKIVAEEGILDDVDYVYGLHVWGDNDAGKIETRVGPFLASSDSFIITVTGKGGHAASPHETFDPTSVLVDIYNALQKIISREIDPLEHVVLSSPRLSGSDAHNIIPARAVLEGTFRTFNEEVREHIINRLIEVAEGYSKAWRCKAEIKFHDPTYPPVVNNKEAVELAKKTLSALDNVGEAKMTMGGEDFAYYVKKTKGAFITLGVRNEEKGIIAPHHHPKFDVDESVLWKGTAIYALLGFLNSFKDIL
ncbi:MAG: amidohydrolase [Candidatus Heimdallarchaeum aukensis]|uniref:Amidohydrolase n=1 Tax=Candidatus Heimdallarchaeum aukensis TaxID=2876573 RepID=A0A9Y1BN95_9ARCH|nr:MAG: amidohydrolase [Candidatus Heimdallarchaeum aukensis]